MAASKRPGQHGPSGEGARLAALAAGKIIDHALLDADGRRAGRVDDLQFQLVPRAGAPERPKLVLRAIVSGPMARPMPRALAAIARVAYRVAGVRDPQAATVPWSHVAAIDAFVHLDVRRGDAGLRAVDEGALRLIRRLPGSKRKQA